MSKHTPGQWVVQPSDEYPNQYVLLAGGRVSDAEDEANVRLIAAAPELLEALREMVAAYEVCTSMGVTHGTFTRHFHSAAARAYTALEKAGGR